MKILICTRGDYLKRIAGDTIQILKTKEELEKKSLQVTISNGKVNDYGEYDVIHIFNITRVQDSYIHFVRARKVNRPIVTSPIFWDLSHFYNSQKRNHHLEIWNRGMGLRRKIMEGSQLICPNSEKEILHINNMFNLDKKFRIVYNGCDKNILHEEEKKWNTVLCSGRITPRKNQLRLAEACEELGLNLHLIGYVNDKFYLEECLKHKNVSYIGKKENSEMSKVYARYNIHALPSYLETPGLATLEAAEQGCAVVSTSIGSCEEYLGEYADYCLPEDELSIIEALKSGQNKTWEEKKQLRRRIHEKFTWEKVVGDLYNYYTEII